MKTPTFLLLFVLICPAFLNAQCQNYSLRFLTINADAHYQGLAETGVITSGNGQVFLPWQENPALLGSAQRGLAVKSNVHRNLSVLKSITPTFLNVSAQRHLSKRLSLGVDAKFFNTGKVTFTDMNGMPSASTRPLEYAISSSLGFKVNNHFSLGGGGSFLRSNLFGNFRPTTLSDYGPVNSFSVHLGAHYHGEKELSELSRLTFEGGLSVTNLGPKVRYSKGPGLSDFIPATLLLGGRIGWEKSIKENQSFGVSLIAQIDHLLVPDCSFDDLDNNGILDFRELGAIGGAFRSFNDHPDGFAGETKAWVKRLALHPWVDLNAKWKLGAGLGLINYTIVDAINLSTLGLNLAYQNFQFEVSNVGLIQGGSNFNVGWSLSLGYHGSLQESKS